MEYVEVTIEDVALANELAKEVLSVRGSHGGERNKPTEP
jgi:hypothetical protein